MHIVNYEKPVEIEKNQNFVPNPEIFYYLKPYLKYCIIFLPILFSFFCIITSLHLVG